MADLMIYLGFFVNSCISCIEIFIEYIWYIPILGTNLGDLIFSLIILLLAFNLFNKWILGPYKNRPNKKEAAEIERLKAEWRERRNKHD